MRVHGAGFVPHEGFAVHRAWLAVICEFHSESLVQTHALGMSFAS